MQAGCAFVNAMGIWRCTLLLARFIFILPGSCTKCYVLEKAVPGQVSIPAHSILTSILWLSRIIPSGSGRKASAGAVRNIYCFLSTPPCMPIEKIMTTKSTGWKIPLLFAASIILLAGSMYLLMPNPEYPEIQPALQERARDTKIDLEAPENRDWKKALVESASGFLPQDVKDSKLLGVVTSSPP